MMTRSSPEPASVKQALSSLRMLFDWLLVHQVVRENPAAAVRGPKLSVTEGKTPNLPAEEVAVLIESIPTDTLVGLRDRALIGLMAYTFARVGAALAMNVDYYQEGKQWSVRLREQAQTHRRPPCARGVPGRVPRGVRSLRCQGRSPLRTARGKTGELTENRVDATESDFLMSYLSDNALS
jgi:site-specific recombinase XerC